MAEDNKQSTETTLALIGQKLDSLEKKIDKIDSSLECDYVTQDQLDPIKRIVYGMVGVILLSVVAALFALLVK